MSKLGILGGSFDPIHLGHMNLAYAALGYVDKVIFMPSGNPPHKAGLTDGRLRAQMIRLSIASETRFMLSEMELDRDGVTYTIDTLRELKRIYSGDELFFISGEDTLHDLCNWHEAREVFSLVTFLVLRREGEDVEEKLKLASDMGMKYWYMQASELDVSATAVREALQSDGDVSSLLPAPVMRFIKENGLYTEKISPYSIDEMKKMLREDLKKNRYEHSLSVLEMGEELAERHSLSMLKTRVACILHDCARHRDMDEMIRLAKAWALRDGQSLDETLLSSRSLLHSIAGAEYAYERYGVRDIEVLRAISKHTCGAEQLTYLDMALFLADKIERTRKLYPALEKIRAEAMVSLPRAMLMSLESTVGYVRESGGEVYPMTEKCIEYLKNRFSL
ncbi:MAG: nicotinate-nucleotide adenylyltransferase [Eubacteriales bacterium]|nr:nicotinate-nucleotide adenylyltransferase [Eubacteriales bacterium]MDD3882957.1 nicotinate-nucleotide adenylyltransferase [Eubacteriales bacterium]MDD4513496.1 nicotinate-nucleotide adenylyltransferase [Eubacteriales bacterium]